MAYWPQMQIAWLMFLDWLKETFGSGVEFPSPLVPGYTQGYAK